MTRILSYMNRALWVCIYYVILLTPVYTRVSSRQIRYALGVVSNFYSDLDHFYFYFNISGWFRGNFSHVLSKNGHCSSFFFFKDRFWIPLGCAILEHFVSGVNYQNDGQKNGTVPPFERMLCLDHMTLVRYEWKQVIAHLGPHSHFGKNWGGNT